MITRHERQLIGKRGKVENVPALTDTQLGTRFDNVDNKIENMEQGEI